METRASYLAVGGFVLVVAIALLAFVIWLGAGGPSEEDDLYIINFSGSVTGLAVGSPVRYRGIPVGVVQDMAIDPNNLAQVRVTIAVRPDTPIVDDNVASLEVQGLAGGVYVQILGGTLAGQPLVQDPDGDPPEIRAIPSAIEAVFQSVPQILDELTTALDQINRLLSDDNVDALSGVLADVQALSSALADPHDGVPALAVRANGLVQELDSLVAEARVDMARISDGAVATLETAETQIAALGTDVAATARSITDVANELEVLVRTSRPGVAEFSESGLYEFTLMVSELRGLATTLTRVAEQFERDPAQFILGEPVSGVSVR